MKEFIRNYAIFYVLTYYILYIIGRILHFVEELESRENFQQEPQFLSKIFFGKKLNTF